jgi:hypothetical protein
MLYTSIYIYYDPEVGRHTLFYYQKIKCAVTLMLTGQKEDAHHATRYWLSVDEFLIVLEETLKGQVRGELAVLYL